MKHILVPDSARPFATLYVGFPAGSLQDPPGKAGLAHLTSTLMMRGVGGDQPLDRAALATAIEYLGSTLDVHVGRDSLTAWCDGLTRHRAATSRLAARVLAEPTFPEAELDKLKRETVADINALVDDDAALGQRFFVRALFEGHPYGRPIKGTELSLAGITRADCVAFHAAAVRREGVILGGAGDLDAAELARLEGELLGRLPSGRAPMGPIPIPRQRPGYHVVLVDKPERTQTQVFIGHLAPDAQHPDFNALMVAQTVFGGTFTARLSHEIREKRGWSYGAYSFLSGDQRLGTVSMRFYPSEKDTVAALRLTDEMYRAFRAEGPTATELEAAQSYLQNSHVFSVDTAPRRLSELVSAALLGHPDDWVDTTVERLRAITPDAVHEAVRRHVTPDDVTVTVVCTAKNILPELEAWGRASSITVVDWKTAITDPTAPPPIGAASP